MIQLKETRAGKPELKTEEPGRCKTHWEGIKGRTQEGERAEWKKEVRCVRGKSGGHQVAAEG